MNWGTPADIRNKMMRRWERGELLAARLTGEALFPMAVPLKKPSSRDLAERFEAVRGWVRNLEQGSRDTRGFGYQIEYREIRHRVHGRNRLPANVVVPDSTDALRLIGKLDAAARFDTLASEALTRFPALRDWLIANPLNVLAHAQNWPRLLAVIAWFVSHPRSGIYRRQMEIPGVDTKFIEAHRGVLIGMLDSVLPEAAIDRDAAGVSGFDRRYGLREEPARVRFRILDPALAIAGLTDLTIPVEAFSRLDLPVERVFVTENKINGLAFPACRRSIVVMGLGYGIDRLAGIDWVREAALHYWGDIDTHGFSILNRFRHHFPSARSLLMDEATLLAHRPLWTQEGPKQRFSGKLDRLEAGERTLFECLRDDRYGERIRLEQERIHFGYLREALARIDVSTGGT
ncbi:MAG: DUF3322 domain-containing protein [Halothiobacillaceae bacterium]